MFEIRKSSLLSALLTYTALTTACAASGTIAHEDRPEVGATSAPLTLAAADDSIFADVSANGTGCPSGTWDVDISEAGDSFTVAFDAYEVSVDPNSSVGIKDCQLSVRLHSSTGLTLAVNSFSYQGYAELSEGVSGIHTASYYFQGNPLAGNEVESELVGPYADDFYFQDEIETSNLVWSPCGVERTMNVATRLRVRNDDQSSGTGYMTLGSVDGTGQERLVIKLNWRRCES
jgi:Domain of unknown function (DUF4360)